MKITTINQNDVEIAVVSSNRILITDVQSAVDLIAAIHFETGCERIILRKSLICEEFFDLKTKLAGEILQKFINYHTKIAVVGDFSTYTSKNLQDFFYESNRGRSIFFLSSEKQAAEKLSMGGSRREYS